MRWLLFFSLTFSPQIWAQVGAGGVSQKISPETSWCTISSPHFNVRFPCEAKEFAQEWTRRLEFHWIDLAHKFQQPSELSEKIEAVVRNDTDEVYASTDVFPFNRVVVNIHAGALQSTLLEVRDWIDVMARHELTHILTGKMRTGVFGVAQYLFGTSASPNRMLPWWWIEGIAVHEESGFRPDEGRLHSPLVEGHLRAARWFEVPEEVRISLDRLNSGPEHFPGALTPYLFGGELFEWKSKHASSPEDQGPALSSRMGARIPGFLVGDWKETWEALEKEWREVRIPKLREEAEPMFKVRKATTWAALPQFFAEPTYLENKLYLAAETPDGGQELVELNKKSDGSVEKRVLSKFRWGGASRIWGVPANEQCHSILLYSKHNRFSDYQLFSDLFIYDLNEQKEYRLTDGERGFDPAVSEDFCFIHGAWKKGKVVFTKHFGDGQSGVVIQDAGEERVAFRTQDFSRVRYAMFGKGKWRNTAFVIFASRNRGARLALLTASGNLNHIQIYDQDLELDDIQTPQFLDSKGDARLYFSVPVKDAFGETRALYACLLEEKESGLSPYYTCQSEMVAKSPLGLSSPQISENGSKWKVLASEPNGYGVSLLEWEQSAPDLKSSKRGSLKKEPPTTKPSPLTESPALSESEGTNVFPSLWPHFWYPGMTRVTDGFQLGGRTEGQDALGHHRYSVGIVWDTRADFPVYDLGYRYEGWHPSLSVTQRQTNEYLASFVQSNRIVETDVAMKFPMSDFFVGFGGQAKTSELLGESQTSGGFYSELGVNLLSGPNLVMEVGLYSQLRLYAFFVGDEQFFAEEGSFDFRMPLGGESSVVRLLANGSFSNNDILSANYYVGGGEQSLHLDREFLVRGYPEGVLLGRRVVTANLEWMLGLYKLFRGVNEWPLFLKKLKSRVCLDVGNAEYVNQIPNEWSAWIAGAGVQLMADMDVVYHLPMTFSIGLHRGFQESNLAETQVVFGIHTTLFSGQ